ncbi:MAG: hypothetical protein EP347_05035 [Alphaproteobacteria bacterium]|nr:MAG: hypothetical protein EP347_05035 [Alphaproteobacteria bacterium]
MALPSLLAATAAASNGGAHASADDFTVDLPAAQQDASATSDVDSCYAGWRFDTTGNVDLLASYGSESWSNNNHTWGTPASYLGSNIGEFFQIRATLNSGSIDTGTTGTWMNLSTTRTWKSSDTNSGGGGGNTANLTIEIRRADTLVVIDSQTYTIEASYFEPPI